MTARADRRPEPQGRQALRRDDTAPRADGQSVEPTRTRPHTTGVSARLRPQARGLLCADVMSRRAPLRLAFATALAAVATLGPAQALASPAVDGTRNLSLGNNSRASSYGSNALLANPSNMSFSGVFAIEPMYQLNIRSRTSGLGVVVMDSLNNSRVSLGLGYLFMRGTPTVTFTDEQTGAGRDFELSRFGHEAFAAVSVAIVKRWLSFGIKPKYQYASLRYRDSTGAARNASHKLSAFGLDLSMTANLAGWAAIAVVATNLTGFSKPSFTDDSDVSLVDVGATAGTIRYKSLSELAEYPLGVAWGVSVFPLHKIDFSINADGYYDFSTFKFEKVTRNVYGGSAEFVAGPVPLRFGTTYDSRGRGKADDRVFVSGGIAYVRQAPLGSVGVDIGFGFSQQVKGPLKETILGLNLGLRLNPDL